MKGPEKMYAGLTAICLVAGAVGGIVELQHGGAEADHQMWNAQKGQLALELKKAYLKH